MDRLKQHIETVHKGINKLYGCDIKFNDRSNLRHHDCDQCDAKYVQSISLKRHIETVLKGINKLYAISLKLNLKIEVI